MSQNSKRCADSSPVPSAFDASCSPSSSSSSCYQRLFPPSPPSLSPFFNFATRIFASGAAFYVSLRCAQPLGFFLRLSSAHSLRSSALGVGVVAFASISAKMANYLVTCTIDRQNPFSPSFLSSSRENEKVDSRDHKERSKLLRFLPRLPPLPLFSSPSLSSSSTLAFPFSPSFSPLYPSSWALSLLTPFLVQAALGVFVFKSLGGSFSCLFPSSLLHRGSFAVQSMPARGHQYASSSERSLLSLLFARHGCHHCGTKRGKVIADHIPPNKLLLLRHPSPRASSASPVSLFSSLLASSSKASAPTKSLPSPSGMGNAGSVPALNRSANCDKRRTRKTTKANTDNLPSSSASSFFSSSPVGTSKSMKDAVEFSSAKGERSVRMTGRGKLKRKSKSALIVNNGTKKVSARSMFKPIRFLRWWRLFRGKQQRQVFYPQCQGCCQKQAVAVKSWAGQEIGTLAWWGIGRRGRRSGKMGRVGGRLVALGSEKGFALVGIAPGVLRIAGANNSQILLLGCSLVGFLPTFPSDHSSALPAHNSSPASRRE